MFIHIVWIQVPNEQVRPDIVLDLLVIQRAFGNTHRSSEQFDHTQHCDSIVCVYYVQEFDKTIARMSACQFIFWHVNRSNPAYLTEKLGQQLLATGGVQVPDIHRSILIAVFDNR